MQGSPASASMRGGLGLGFADLHSTLHCQLKSLEARSNPGTVRQRSDQLAHSLYGPNIGPRAGPVHAQSVADASVDREGPSSASSTRSACPWTTIATAFSTDSSSSGGGGSCSKYGQSNSYSSRACTSAERVNTSTRSVSDACTKRQRIYHRSCPGRSSDV